MLTLSTDGGIRLTQTTDLEGSAIPLDFIVPSQFILTMQAHP
jgi:hypothetical protein